VISRIIPSLAARTAAYNGMANRNVFAIAGITIFLMVGVVVVIGVTGTILLLLYTVLSVALSSLFGIELPKLH